MGRYIWKNPITTATVESKARFVVHQGGTYSLKTFGNLMALIILVSESEVKVDATVVAASYPVLRKGARRDFVDIMRDYGTFEKKHWNITDGIYKFGAVGSFIEFLSVDNVGKAKLSKRDYLLINEADNVPYEIARTLMTRTRKKIIIEYNPTEEFWVHDKILTRGAPEVQFFRSTYKHTIALQKQFDCEIIPQGIIDDLEESRTADPEYFKIYGLGITGSKKGRVIKHIRVVPDMPPISQCKWAAIGIDYGYTNDPTCVVDVRFAQGALWVDQLHYGTGVGTEMISGILEAAAVDGKRVHIKRRGVEIYPDASERWGNEELKADGWNVQDVDNRAGSVQYGIDTMNRYTVNITAHSKDVLRDCRSHKHKIDPKTGEYTNAIENKNKHAPDAIRYPAMSKLYLPVSGKQKYHGATA